MAKEKTFDEEFAWEQAVDGMTVAEMIEDYLTDNEYSISTKNKSDITEYLKGYPEEENSQLYYRIVDKVDAIVDKK